MRNFPKIELEVISAPFTEFGGVFRFVRNLFRLPALLPHVLEAEAGMARAVLLDHQALSRSQTVFMLLAVAAAYRNTYCVTACHGRLLHSLGGAERQLDEIIDYFRTDRLMSGTAVIDFALKLAINVLGISGRDIAGLRECGPNAEAILVTALSNFFCMLLIELSPVPDFKPRTFSRQNNSAPDERSCVGGILGPHLRRADFSPARFPPFAFFLQRFGVIPNILRTHTLRPDVTAAEADLTWTVFVPDYSLSHVQKEFVLLVGSAADKALLDFALKPTVRLAEFRSDDIKNLQCHGFIEEHILKASATAARNSFLNMLQMGLGRIPDVKPKRVFRLPNAQIPVNHEGSPGDGQIDPDAALVTRVQDGNLEDFEELVARHSRRVYRTLVSIIGNVEEAQDALQDTFLKAFVHIDNFQRRSKFSTWLTSIASNIALQRLRDRKCLEHFDDIGDESEFRPFRVRAWDTDPEQLYSQAERRRLVENGLMKLPSKYRVVLVLRDIEQLSTEEAATALGLGIPALKARLFRGRTMLREVLSPHFAVSA